MDPSNNNTTTSNDSPATKYSPPSGIPNTISTGADRFSHDGRLRPASEIDYSRFDLPYGSALGASFLFYEAQRSGDLPSDNRIDWRGDSAMDDGSRIDVDLSGGWFGSGGVAFCP